MWSIRTTAPTVRHRLPGSSGSEASTVYVTTPRQPPESWVTGRLRVTVGLAEVVEGLGVTAGVGLVDGLSAWSGVTGGVELQPARPTTSRAPMPAARRRAGEVRFM